MNVLIVEGLTSKGRGGYEREEKGKGRWGGDKRGEGMR